MDSTQPRCDEIFAAFVGVKALCEIDLDRLASSLSASSGYRIDIKKAGAAGAPSVLVINLADRLYNVLAMPFPVPLEDLSSACRTAYAWPTAGQAAEQAAAHLIVAPQAAAHGHAKMVEQAAELTSIVAAITAITPSLFVYWVPGDVLAKPESFRQSATEMMRDSRPPVLSWVQFRLIPGKAVGRPGTIGMLTTGLRPFVGYELRVEPFAASPVDAARVATRLADYLLRQGAVVEDGDKAELEGMGEVIFRLGEVAGVEGAILRAQIAEVAN